MEPLYNELGGNSEIVHTMEIYYYRGWIVHTVNAVLGQKLCPYSIWSYMDVLNREAPLYTYYCNSQTYSCSVYTLTTCVHVTHLGIISFPGNASNGCDGVKAGMLIFSANTAIGFTALFWATSTITLDWKRDGEANTYTQK